MWSLKTIAYLFAFSGGCVFALANPLIGVVTYMLVYQIHPSARWWGLPLADIGFRFSLLAAVFTLLGVMAAPRLVPRARPWITPWEACLVLLLVIGIINTHAIGLGPRDMSLMLLDKFWKMILFLLILNRVASTRRNFRIVLWALVLGSLYLGHDAYTAPPRAFVHGRLEGIGGPDFSTTSGLAAHMSAMLPIIGAVFLATKSWKWRALAAISGAYSFNAIILCRTRSAFVGLALGAVAALLMAPRARRYRILALLVVGGVAGYGLTDGHFWERMATMSTRESLEADSAAMTRLDLSRAATQMIRDYPHGIGMGNFPALVGQYAPDHEMRACHNTVLLCLVEFGVQGGVVFFAMMGLAVVSLIRAARLAKYSRDPVETKLYTYCALVAFVTYFVTGLGTERLYCESFWWVMAMPQWIEQMVRREAAEVVPALALLDTPLPDDSDALLGVPDDAATAQSGHRARPQLA